MSTPRGNQLWHNFTHSVDVLIASALAGRQRLNRGAENPDDAAIVSARQSSRLPGSLPAANDNDDVVFLLKAAAGGPAEQAILSESECGLWTLEIFVGMSPADRSEERGSVVLAVHADSRDAYEGRMASVYVGAELLAQGVIVNGELFSDVALRGVDLQKVDEVRVRFAAEKSPLDAQHGLSR
jgi:hypothetical protein